MDIYKKKNIHPSTAKKDAGSAVRTHAPSRVAELMNWLKSVHSVSVYGAPSRMEVLGWYGPAALDHCWKMGLAHVTSQCARARACRTIKVERQTYLGHTSPEFDWFVSRLQEVLYTLDSSGQRLARQWFNGLSTWFDLTSCKRSKGFFFFLFFFVFFPFSLPNLVEI